MSEQVALVRQPDRAAIIPFGSEWDAMNEIASKLVESGFLPPDLNTPAKALAVILAGRELGVPPMQAIRGIHVVNGRPSLSAELMLALAYQNIPGFEFSIDITTDQLCKVTGTRPGRKPVTITFNMTDANRAGLAGGNNWKKYPQAMLRARAISALMRIVAPDAIRGIYTPEELGQSERETEVDALSAARGVEMPAVGVDANSTIIDAEEGAK